MIPLNTIAVPAVEKALTSYFGEEAPNLEDLGAFIAMHRELGFTLRPAYVHDRGIVVDAVANVATCHGDVHVLVVTPALFGPFGAEWDTVVGEDITEIAERMVRASERARGLRGEHLTVQR